MSTLGKCIPLSTTYSVIFLPLRCPLPAHTCVMPALQAAMVIADGIEVIQEVTMTAFLVGVFPGPPLAATTTLCHMGSHVKPPQREVHKCGEFMALFTHLPEALQMDDEDIRKGPQTELHSALLKHLTVGASPSIIRSQLQRKRQSRPLWFCEAQTLFV